MQAELCYYGKITELSYLDQLPWGHFVYLYRWLCDVKKEEKQAHEAARKEQEAAMAAARSRSRGSSHTPRIRR